MRRIVEMACDGAVLLGTLDVAQGRTGVLIVSGGNEIRVGAHRGMARLAEALSALGHPVFRFDRRGVGDSEGDNCGFRSSGPDIAVALDAFRAACPAMNTVVGFGNCDAATALVLHRAPVDTLLLANPWIIEVIDALPPAPAIRDHYARRIRDPEAWAALLTGKVDLRAVAKGLGRLAVPKRHHSLAEEFAAGLAFATTPVHVVLAARDNTAIAFADAWEKAIFDQLRSCVTVQRIDTASHSFGDEGDFGQLLAAVLALTSSLPG